MKRNWTSRIAFLAVVMLLITTSLISGTFAKYTTEFTASDTARVAKFDVNVTDGTDTITGTIDIFDGPHTNVLPGVAENIIAPGTTGSFELEVSNNSEVAVAATVTLSETNAEDVPIYYTLGADTQRYSDVLTGTYGDPAVAYKTVANLATALQTALTPAAGTYASSTIPATTTFDINWTWDFGGASPDAAAAAGTQTDASDTTLGEAGTATVELDVTVTATQVD